MKKTLSVCLVAAAGAVLAVLSIKSDARMETAADTAPGLSVIENMEQQDVASAQAEIDRITEAMAGSGTGQGTEAQGSGADTGTAGPSDAEAAVPAEARELSADEIKKLNFKKIFSDSVIIGDSIAGSICEYEYLTSSQVVYKTGVSIPNSGKQLPKAQSLHPKYVFLAYGNNDVSRDKYNCDLFRSDYEKLLKKAKKLFPDAKICANAIFPVTGRVKKKEPWFKELDRYNTIIEETCQKYEVTYLDCTDLAQKKYFEPDGCHFVYGFYPFWLYRMAKGAGLL